MKIRILRRKDVEKVTGLSRSSIYRKMAEGIFPTQVSLGERTVGWLESEIQDWLRQQVESTNR